MLQACTHVKPIMECSRLCDWYFFNSWVAFK